MRPVLDTRHGVELVLAELEGRPGRRPRPADLAGRVRRTVPQLRRDQRVNHAAPLAEVISYACTLYAVVLIGSGVKCEAAMQLAGFKNKTNFNRNVRDYFGALPHDFVRATRPRTLVRQRRSANTLHHMGCDLLTGCKQAAR